MIEDGCKNIASSRRRRHWPTSADRSPLRTAGSPRGNDPRKMKVVKVPLAPGDYSAQVAQLNTPQTDCLFGHLGEVNWPPIVNRAGPVSVPSRGSTARRQPRPDHRQRVPEGDRRWRWSSVCTRTSPRPCGRTSATRSRSTRPTRAQLQQPRRSWHLDRFHRLHHRRGNDGRLRSTTRRSSTPLRRPRPLDTGGMVGVLTSPRSTGGGGKVVRIFNRSVFFDVDQGRQV